MTGPLFVATKHSVFSKRGKHSTQLLTSIQLLELSQVSIRFLLPPYAQTLLFSSFFQCLLNHPPNPMALDTLRPNRKRALTLHRLRRPKLLHTGY